MESQIKPGAAFALSLVAGVLLLLGGGLASMWFTAGSSGFGGMTGGFGGMMGGYQGMMGGMGVPSSYMGGLSLIGVLSGIFVIIGAVMLNTNPADHITWGAVILAFSLISILGMGGFFIGAIVGIIGGILALSWAPPRTTAQPS